MVDPDADDVDDAAAVDIDAPAPVFADPHARMPAVLPTMLPGPPSWAAVFGRKAPLEVELGFGRPHFILERAAEAPERDVVGIEWKGRWPRTVWEKQRKAGVVEGVGGVPGLSNVRAIHGNAWILFGALFQPASVSSIFINFPDPWWKAKHKKRRIVSDSFARLLASRLVPGGMVLVQTDVASLLEELLDRLEAAGLANPNGRGRLCPKKPVGASSHREKRCRADAVPIFRATVFASR